MSVLDRDLALLRAARIGKHHIPTPERLDGQIFDRTGRRLSLLSIARLFFLQLGVRKRRNYVSFVGTIAAETAIVRVELLMRALLGLSLAVLALVAQMAHALG